MNCLIKRFVLKKLNSLVKEHGDDIGKVKSSVKLWSKRADLVQEFLASLLKKLEDNEITVEELKSLPGEFDRMTKGW